MSNPITLKVLAKEAIDVQNACNPLGLTLRLAEVMKNLRAALDAEKLPSGTRDLCNHPVFKLWASKLHDLAGMGLSDTDAYGEAYAKAKELAEQPA